ALVRQFNQDVQALVAENASQTHTQSANDYIKLHSRLREAIALAPLYLSDTRTAYTQSYLRFCFKEQEPSLLQGFSEAMEQYKQQMEALPTLEDSELRTFLLSQISQVQEQLPQFIKRTGLTPLPDVAAAEIKSGGKRALGG